MPEPNRRLLHTVEGTAMPAADDASILVCEFKGIIGDGSAGNTAVDEMAGTVERALAGGAFRSLLLDISGVRYTFGNHALGLLMNLGHRNLNLALVVSEQCGQLGTFAKRIGDWSVYTTRSEALQNLRAGGAAA